MKLFVWKFNDSLVEYLPATALAIAETREEAIDMIVAERHDRDMPIYDRLTKEELRKVLEEKEPEIIEGGFGIIADEYRP